MEGEYKEYTPNEVNDLVEKYGRLILLQKEIEVYENKMVVGHSAWTKTPEEFVEELNSVIESMKRYNNIPKVYELIELVKIRKSGLEQLIYILEKAGKS
ncbi:hypothetical protein HYX17_05170 [Candidatus Woesearchaeota archaeon]|nr:hypothetical protein [Candidatus Woesearchaeota archaeon]